MKGNIMEEAGRIAEAAFAVSLVVAGAPYTTKVIWQNIGTKSHAFDLITGYGTYNPATGDFTFYKYVFFKENVASSPGQALSTLINCGVESDTPLGKYDVIAILCDFTLVGSTITINVLYDEMVKEDCLEVGAVEIGGKITDISVIG